MKREKRFFLILSILLALLFVLATVSIIFVFVVDFENNSENIMSTVFLFLHALIVAGAFYFAFKAFMQKSQLMSIFMIDENGRLIKKSEIVSIVLSALALCVGVYFTLLCCGVPVPLTFFAKGLKFALMNVGYAVGIVALFFAIYPKVYNK